MEHVCISGGHINKYSYGREFSKTKSRNAIWPIPFPDISSKDGKSVHIRGTYTAVVIAAVFTLASI